MKAFITSLLLILSFFLNNLYSQVKFTDNLFINSNYAIGYILPEYQFLNYVVSDFASSYEFSITKETVGKNEWEQLYNYPGYGLRFLYSDLGSPEILGEVYGIYPFFNITFLNLNRFKIINQTGLGISYVTKKFDLEENYLNVAIGSNFNMHFNFRINASYELTKKLRINTGLSFDHFSNANTSEPNLGINYLTWNSGLSLAVGAVTEKEKSDLSDQIKSIEKELVLNVGGKHSRALSSKYYLTNSISYEIRKKYFKAFHLGIGTDLFYDTSVEDQLLKNNREYSKSFQFQTGIHISQAIIYNRFSITLQEGIYLGLNEKVEGYVMYNRGIFKYWINDQFSFRLSMKSHLHILDYPEIGLGIKL